MIYIVTRHIGALQWLLQNISEPAIHLTHLTNTDALQPGDMVIGTLPINLVADICRLGVRYLHLEIEIPLSLRGKELSIDQLNELGATLVEYYAYTPCPDEVVLKSAEKLEC